MPNRSLAIAGGNGIMKGQRSKDGWKIPPKRCGAYENRHRILERGGAFVEVSKVLELMLGFGSFLISLLTLVVALTKKDTKK